MTNIYQGGIALPPILNTWQSVATSSTSSTLLTFVSAVGTAITLTPKATTSKFLIIANGVFGSRRGFASIFRGSTNLGSSSYGFLGGNRPSIDFHQMGMTVLDAPGTTSSITYEVRIRSDDGNSATWWFLGDATMTILELGV